MAAAERKRLEDAGMKVTHLPDEEVKQFRRMANDSRFEDLAQRIDGEQLARIRSLIVRD